MRLIEAAGGLRACHRILRLQGPGWHGEHHDRVRHHEGDELHATDVVAERLRARLVVADGLQDLAERRLDDALTEFPNAKAQTRQQFIDNQILPVGMKK